MGPKAPVTEKDLFRHPLREQINLKHPRIRLVDPINRERLGVSMSASFVRPATSPRLIAGLRYLQTKPPIDPSSLTRWRKRLGEASVEKLLAETIDAATRAGVIKTCSAKRVIVDTPVMPKAITHATDTRLLERFREHLVRAAARQGPKKLRQSYNCRASRLAMQISRYARAKQYRPMGKALRTLRSVVN